MNSKGFTLLEILIAVTILAIISTLTAININKSVKFKAKIEQDLDDYSSVRDALIIMTHDVNTAFHWVDINAELKRQLSGTPAGSPGATPAAPVAPVTTTSGPPGELIPIDKLTSFEGETDFLYLTTLSHVRTIMDTKESDQAKIGYYLKDVKSLHGHQDTKALIRSESPILDGEGRKGGVETVLLENIKSLKFRYMGADDKEWIDKWKTIETDDTTQKNNFPDAVEISITTMRKGREISLSTIAAIHNTNNNLLNQLTGATNGTPAPGTSPGTTPAATAPQVPAAPGAPPQAPPIPPNPH
jgi:general secretion pathway protein J